MVRGGLLLLGDDGCLLGEPWRVKADPSAALRMTPCFAWDEPSTTLGYESNIRVILLCMAFGALFCFAGVLWGAD